MTDEKKASGPDWLANYPRYPSKISGFLCVALGVAGLAAAAVDWWDPSVVTTGLGVIAIVLGLWAAWADR
ncbi:hypothetical protein [Halobellus sp. EA9]|uniref:hypothetical protein n=1 Tax=Halobellus sp. EA9 TaxID=3421647 RepID=UPI003EC07BBB